MDQPIGTLSGGAELATLKHELEQVRGAEVDEPPEPSGITGTPPASKTSA